MPWIAPVVGAAATIYGANRAKKSSSQLANSVNQAGQFKPTATNYGSSLGYRRDPLDSANVQQFINIDPRIRGLREQTLGRLGGYRESLGAASQGYLGQLGGISNELQSNNNPFIQARVNPLIARQSQARGNLQQDLGRRNIGLGTSFGANSLANFESITGREVADQQALATRETLAARLGIDAQMFGAVQQTIQGFQGMDAQEQSIAAANLSQELVSLGLSQQDASAAIAAAGLQAQGDQNSQNILGRGLYGLGQFDWGSFGKGSGGTASSLNNTPQYGIGPGAGTGLRYQ